jgi:tetratricopeptide (TPR) repeat protein
MAEHSRVDDLRRRVQKDPASIAFAQLAEELRRSGGYQEAVDTCRAGLKIHPGYLSARVTLGRALIELGQLDEAQAELSLVLESAPENLAAIRGLAEIHHRNGDLVRALAQYRAALLLARNDPDLEETIDDLSRQVEPATPASSGGLTLQHMQDELLKLAPRKGDGSHLSATDLGPESAESGPFGGQVSAEKTPVPISQADTPAAPDASREDAGSHDAEPSPEPSPPSAQSTQRHIFSAISADSAVSVVPPPDGRLPGSADDRATRTVAALEQWLAAIHVTREDRHA